MATAHGFNHLLLGKVSSSVLHSDPCFQVVEVAAIQLEELDQEDAQVYVGRPAVDPGVELNHNSDHSPIQPKYTAINKYILSNTGHGL